MSEIIFEILKYEFDKKNIITYFTLKLSFNDENYMFILELPTNPECELEILKLNKKNINYCLSTLKKMVNNSEYSFKTNECLKKVYNWITILLNPYSQMIL